MTGRRAGALWVAGALALGALSASAETKEVLSLAAAKKVGAAAAAEARRLRAPGGAIAVVDDGGHLLYLERLDGTFPAAASVATAKARTAATFRRPTVQLENAVQGGRTSLVAVAEMTPLQGGVPLMLGSQVVGAVGISGAASAQQDEEIARKAAAALEDKR